MDSATMKKMPVTKKKERRRRRRWHKNKLQLLSMCTIPMLLVFVFQYLPMGGLVLAFKDYRYDLGIFGSSWVGMKNFNFVLRSNDFFRIARNTIVLNALFITVGLIVAVALAIMLYDVKRRIFVKTYQTILIIPYYLSWVIVGYMTYAMLNPAYGTINSMLQMFGLNKVDWYGEPVYWPAILTIANTWKNMGINCVMYYAALMGIDHSYFEAAEIDGANKWQVTRYITIPSLVPLMTILTILSIGNIFRADFGLFYQLTRDVGALYSTTDVMDTYIYRVMRSIGDIPMSTAVGFLQSIVGFVLVLLTNYIVNRIEPDNALF